MSNNVRVTIEFLEDGEVIEKRGTNLEYQRWNTATFNAGYVETTIRDFNPWDGRKK